mmetsp:Transcript_11812/g.14339  ORF Transcript_11812/g.14339 Transcript_11812/m.14339 type:complete len:201 (+) Transcript_11812:82-684(+)|eukprot:CAMPEP_0184018678 /NCGR_PEP_ID=MMETSP0954-20121128/8284_1 /TAXON_ID=627963 /ORGANISM="Aplanochytrium sp, Strain PBS07" /LENGTH=200 /DNA_ID=CAMNT_0026300169 /DNA_START=53 /DNA_END=655 /DNA_ORIENTATION=-
MARKSLQVAVVGDSGVGKTSFLNKLAYEVLDTTPREEYEISTNVNRPDVGGRGVTVEFKEADEETDLEQPILFRNAGCILICFSPEIPGSFHNVTRKWIPALQMAGSTSPVVLVCCKSDLRKKSAEFEREGITMVDEDIAAELAGSKFADLEIKEYLECSALEDSNLMDVVETCAKFGRIRTVLNRPYYRPARHFSAALT